MEITTAEKIVNNLISVNMLSLKVRTLRQDG